MQMQPEARFALPGNYPESPQIELDNYLFNNATGMLRRTVFPELAYAPFPQGSISKLELVSNLPEPQTTLVLSTGESNLGAHSFSNQISLSSVIEAEAQAIRLLGQSMRYIRLPIETISMPVEADCAVLGRLLDYTSLEVGHKIFCLSHLRMTS